MIFELGILDMLVSSGHHSIDKCVYVAPTKVRFGHDGGMCKWTNRVSEALCSERMRDWTEKFEPLGIKCAFPHSRGIIYSSFAGCELTGDTVDFGRTAWKEARTAKIM